MKGVPNFSDAAWQKKESDAEFIKTIKNGHKPMPAYKDKLNDDEIRALVAYVRSFAK
jgi:mono/diheme cytochrome c family protein